MPTIQPNEARQLLAAGAAAVDVREQWEYLAGHLPGAIHLSLGELEHAAAKMLPDKEQPLIVYCTSGARSARAAGWLRTNGWRNVWDLGSIKAWPYGIEHA